VPFASQAKGFFLPFLLVNRMPISRSNSIVMRVSEFGETDLLVSFFSREHGRLKGVAKAGRKSVKRFANSLDILCLTDMEYEQGRGDLCFLHSGRLVDNFGRIRQSYEGLATASYLLELTEILFPQDLKAERMFDFLENALRSLDSGMDEFMVKTAFEAGAMSLGGFALGLNRCCRCGRAYAGKGRAVVIPAKGAIACLKCEKESLESPGLSPQGIASLKAMQLLKFLTLPPPSPSAQELKEIGAVLARHIDYRLGRRPRSARFLL